MLHPPEGFRPTSPRQYFWQLGLGPALCVAVVFGWHEASLAFLALSLPGMAAGAGMAWLSVFGRRQAILGSLTAWCFFYLPLALAATLIAMPAEARPGAITLGIVGIQCLTLILATAWHGRRCPSPTAGDRVLSWPGIRLDLTRRTIHRDSPVASPGVGGAAAALASVPLYHALRPWLESEPGLASLALAMNLLCAGLTATTVARPLAQGWRLRAVERGRGLFVSERLPELERLRQDHAVGRWLRQRIPLRAEV